MPENQEKIDGEINQNSSYSVEDSVEDKFYHNLAKQHSVSPNLIKNISENIEKKMLENLENLKAPEDNRTPLQRIFNNFFRQKNPDPIKYTAGEILKEITSKYVKDPKDSTYQITRRIVSKILDKDKNASYFIKESAILGIYKVLDDFLRK